MRVADKSFRVNVKEREKLIEWKLEFKVNNCPYFTHIVINLLVVISISFEGFAQKRVYL